MAGNLLAKYWVSGMVKIIFLLIGLILIITDTKFYLISNWIVLPAIILGVILARHYYWPMILFSIGAVLFKYKFWRGGDVKLISMLGAFLGHKAILILGISLALLLIYRKIRNDNRPIPYAPFAIGASLLFL